VRARKRNANALRLAILDAIRSAERENLSLRTVDIAKRVGCSRYLFDNAGPVRDALLEARSRRMRSGAINSSLVSLAGRVAEIEILKEALAVANDERALLRRRLGTEVARALTLTTREKRNSDERAAAAALEELREARRQVAALEFELESVRGRLEAATASIARMRIRAIENP
jgi:hypothetical protein